MATTPHGRGPSGAGSLSFADWIQLHARAVAIGVVAVVAIAAFVFVYQRYQASTAREAEQAYFTAQSAGAPAERERALDGVIGRYDGTAAATQAAMMLAQLRYERGAFQEGIGALRRVEGNSASAEFEAAIDALIAAGLEGRGDFRGAAAKYREAAEASRFEADRDSYLADAARAHRRGGNEAEATRIWRELADRPGSTVAAEAQVRLGEMTAKPVGRS